MTAFQSLHINGKKYDHQSLKEFCEETLGKAKIEDWEKHLYEFILEFISEKESISVKTSGSTGEPKIIQLSKEVLIKSAKATQEFLGLKKGMNALLSLSTDNIAGKMMVVRSFVSELNLIPVKPSGSPLNETNECIDFAAFVPLQLSYSLENPSLKSVQKLIIGGGRIDANLHRKIINFPNEIYATYGMTETATHIALKKLNTKTEEHYKCLAGIRIEKNEDDCLIINAPHISEHKILTNDITMTYSDTEFEILGRKDNIINTGGIKIIPEELEHKISIFIDQKIMITSIDDKELGEKIILLVENGKTNLNLLYNLWLQLESHLDKYEFPKKIDFMDSFEYTKSGKIHRSLTKNKYLNNIN